MKRVISPTGGFWNLSIAFAIAWLINLSWLCASVQAIDYTDKQLDAFAERLGKIYWITPANDRTPAFLTAPVATAPSFRPPANESFQIIELVGRAAKSPFFKVKFESGKDGYIQPEAFHEELNVTIVSQDPQAEAKKKAQKAVEDESQRIAWIQAQPWSAAAKEAAIKRRVAIGMNATEVRKILGEPTRIIKARQMKGAGAEERWYYPERATLVFTNGLLTHAEEKPQSQK